MNRGLAHFLGYHTKARRAAVRFGNACSFDQEAPALIQERVSPTASTASAAAANALTDVYGDGAGPESSWRY